jgi:periplasmic protein TonB
VLNPPSSVPLPLGERFVVGPPPAVPTSAPPVDVSRSIRLHGGTDWNCQFPPEAEIEQTNEAMPVIEVRVSPAGYVEGVRVVFDPGSGFGRAARACAMRKTFDPELDRSGVAVAGKKSFRVHFTR